MLGKSKAIDANQPIPIAGVARWTFSGMRVSSISPKALATWASVRGCHNQICWCQGDVYGSVHIIKISLWLKWYKYKSISKKDWLEFWWWWPSTFKSWKNTASKQLLLLIFGEFESSEIHLMISQKSPCHHVQKGTCSTFFIRGIHSLKLT